MFPEMNLTIPCIDGENSAFRDFWEDKVKIAKIN